MKLFKQLSPMLEIPSPKTFVSQLSYSNWSRGLRELASRNPIELKNKAMIFYFSYTNLVLRNPRFRSSAPLVLSIALALRSFAPLVLSIALALRSFAPLLALALALAHLPLAQHPYAFDHAFPCPL